MSVRLDKFLSQSGERSRSEAGRLVRMGEAAVNGVCVRDPSFRVAEADTVTLRGAPVADSAWQYYIMNKPAGVLTAARDSRAKTVMSLVPEALLKRGVLPVGRLDKDTTGLLLLTNDGALAHRLLSPKRHVWKRYVATVSGRLDEDDLMAFRNGVQLSDFTALPAELNILLSDDTTSVGEVCVREGKFHQVKRMFLACGHEVLSLRRTCFGTLVLPGDLSEGEYRALRSDELSALRACVEDTRPEPM